MKSASDQTLSNISDSDCLTLNGGVQVKLLGRPFPQRFYNILPIYEPNMTLVQSLQKVKIVFLKIHCHLFQRIAGSRRAMMSLSKKIPASTLGKRSCSRRRRRRESIKQTWRKRRAVAQSLNAVIMGLRSSG